MDFCKMRTLPESFLNNLKSVLPDSEFPAFKAALNSKVPTSIRLHPKKGVGGKIDKPVPWCSNGVYLEERPSFTLDPLFHAGAYYVQEAGSMFLSFVAKQLKLDEPGKMLLDLCAAPGGKSTLLQSIIHQESVLIANEVIQSRNIILRENLSKWGADNLIVTQNDPADFSKLPPLFDALIIDAPCSGEGLFRKTPEAIDEWSNEHVSLCSKRQQRIIRDSLPCLKNNGYLIYSTCTYNKYENDNNIAQLLNDFPLQLVELEVPKDWGIHRTSYGYQFFPHQTKSEGFYLAILQLTDESRQPKPFANKKRKNREKASPLPDYIKLPTGLKSQTFEDKTLLITDSTDSLLPELQKHLWIKQAGITAGSWLKHKFIPHHHLAMAYSVDLDVPYYEVTRDQALNYLRKADIGAVPFVGWGLIRYKQTNLGWIKGLGKRSNNYYPKEWRIRKV